MANALIPNCMVAISQRPALASVVYHYNFISLPHATKTANIVICTILIRIVHK